MSDDTYDQLRRAVVQILGSRPAPERRRQVAADLRVIAEQQERMAAAAAQADVGPRPDKRQESSRPAGMYVRINREPDPQTGTMRVRLSLGRQIWLDLGSPERIDVQRVGTEVWVVGATGRAGYRVSVSMGTPSCVVAPDAPVTALSPGRYAAALRAGAIVVGEKIA